MVEEIFGDFGDDAGALGFDRGELLISGGFFGLDARALAVRGLLDFLAIVVGGLDALVVNFASDHLFEKAVFGLGDFGFGHLDFVLERLVGLVGLDERHLVFVFADAFSGLLDVELVFFAVFEAGELRRLGVLDSGAGGGYTGLNFGDFPGEQGKLGADDVAARVNALQVEQVL